MMAKRRTSPGVLTGRSIKELALVDPIGDDCLKATSCDLRLGRDVFVCGQERSLFIAIDEGGDISIDPFGSIIFSTKETVDLLDHTDIVGRFDLMIEFGLEGLIVQVGPQIEPGWKGPLFGLMLNTQGERRTLKEGQRFLTIEFSRAEGASDEALILRKQVASLSQFLDNQSIRIQPLTQPSAIKQMETRLDKCRDEHNVIMKANDRRRSQSSLKWKKVSVFVGIIALILGCPCVVVFCTLVTTVLLQVFLPSSK